MRHLGLIVLKNGDELLPVESYADGLTQFAIFLGLLGVVSLPYHRVAPVEPQVVNGGLGGASQYQAMIFVKCRLLGRVGSSHRQRHTVITTVGLRNIVITLNEFTHQGHAFLFHGKDDAIDEGHGFATIIQQTQGTITRLAFTGVRLGPEIRVALQYMAPVGYGFHQHIRPCSHGPGIQRQIVTSHARLVVKTIDLPGNRRRESHGQPVFELRVFALDPDTQGVVIECLHTVEIKGTQIKPGARVVFAQCFVGLFQLF